MKRWVNFSLFLSAQGILVTSGVYYKAKNVSEFIRPLQYDEL